MERLEQNTHGPATQLSKRNPSDVSENDFRGSKRVLRASQSTQSSRPSKPTSKQVSNSHPSTDLVPDTVDLPHRPHQLDTNTPRGGGSVSESESDAQPLSPTEKFSSQE